MRGTRHHRSRLLPVRGIIPAYAGNTTKIRPSLTVMVGSSPRMRGTHGDQWMPSVLRGIIPAYAGNTIRACTRYRAAWDHPRVCGEHASIGSLMSIDVGSSPRMRGTLVVVDPSAGAAGIIPAYAGNTDWGDAFKCSMRDHPRVCGEH